MSSLFHADGFAQAHLGVPAFNLNVGEGSISDLDAALGRELPQLPAGSACFVKVPTDRADLSCVLSRHGFYLVDTNVQFEKARGADSAPDPRIRAAAPADREQVGAVAASAFRYTRFHLDPGCSDAGANALKRAWAENFFHGKRGEHMLVAEVDGKVVGFNQVLERGETRVIDLIAVAPGYHRQGLGKALCLAAESLPGAATQMLVGTQIANLPSISLYQGAGYRLAQASYVFHMHRPGGN